MRAFWTPKLGIVVVPDKIFDFANAVARIHNAKEGILFSTFHNLEVESGIPTAEDVKFSQEIWRKE